MRSVFKFMSFLPSLVFATLMCVAGSLGWRCTFTVLFVVSAWLWVMGWYGERLGVWVAANIRR